MPQKIKYKDSPFRRKIGWNAKKLVNNPRYTHCIECGTNKISYDCKGLCTRCHERTRKKYKATWFKKHQAHCVECGTNEKPYWGKGLCTCCREKTRTEYKAKWFQEQQKKKKKSARK